MWPFITMYLNIQNVLIHYLNIKYAVILYLSVQNVTILCLNIQNVAILYLNDPESWHILSEILLLVFFMMELDFSLPNQ